MLHDEFSPDPMRAVPSSLGDENRVIVGKVIPGWTKTQGVAYSQSRFAGLRFGQEGPHRNADFDFPTLADFCRLRIRRITYCVTHAT
jgi:hypothetical protein